MGLCPLAAISENMLSLSFINWGNNDDQNDGMGWCFYWASASEGPGKLRPLTSKSKEQGLSKIIWEGRQAGFCCQDCFFPFFVGWLNYALVSWNPLSIIPLGLSGTQSRTNHLQVPGFLNPANKLKKMHEHLLDSSVLDTGYIMAILPYEQEQRLPVGDAELDSAHVFVHGLHTQLMCFLISPKGVEFTSFKGLGASKLIFSM